MYVCYAFKNILRRDPYASPDCQRVRGAEKLIILLYGYFRGFHSYFFIFDMIYCSLLFLLNEPKEDP